MTAPGGWVWLARLKRTQGRKGEIFAEILTDFPEKFAERRQLWLLTDHTTAAAAADGLTHPGSHDNPRRIELVRYWLHKGGIVLQFAGVDSISAAQELSGLIVAIPRTERAPLEEGEFYIGDLIGCSLVDVAGLEPRIIGEIEDVNRSVGPVAMLVVRDRSDDEILIPFAKDYLRHVDLEAKQVEMILPEGLTDLNR